MEKYQIIVEVTAPPSTDREHIKFVLEHAESSRVENISVKKISRIVEEVTNGK